MTIETDQPEPLPQVEKPIKKSNSKTILLISVLAIALILIATQVTFFAIQPIGAIPEGVTLVMLRGTGTQLFDSADAMCMRIQSGVSLLCRGLVIGQVSKNGTVLFKLPYLEFIYSLSTGGAQFEK